MRIIISSIHHIQRNICRSMCCTDLEMKGIGQKKIELWYTDTGVVIKMVPFNLHEVLVPDKKMVLCEEIQH